MTKKEKQEAEKAYEDRLSMEACTEDLTPEEIEELKEQGRI